MLTLEQDFLQFMDANQFVYQRLEHPAVFTCEEAELYHAGIEAVHTKNLFLCDKKKRHFFLVVTDCEKVVRLDNLSKRLGVSRLRFASEENLGKIEEILIKGLNIDLFIVYKYELILISIMETSMKKRNIRKEAEMALDSFYNLYTEKIKCWNGEKNTFSDFDKMIENQINNYYEKIDQKSFFERMRDFFNKQRGE